MRAEAEALAKFRNQALATIGHEIRTPLNAVIGFSEAMQHELHGPLGNDRYRDYAVHIRESGEQLLRAAETMLMRSHVAASASEGCVDMLRVQRGTELHICPHQASRAPLAAARTD